MPPSNDDRFSLATSSEAAAVAAIAGLSGEPLAAALAPILQLVVSTAREDRLKEFVGNVIERISPEELLRRVHTEPRINDLFTDTARAAVETELERKRKALAKVLRDGFFRTDDAELDVERMYLQAIAPIEVAHLRILDLMSHEQTMGDGGRISVGSSWPEERLHEFYPQAGPMLRPLMTQLEGWGIVVDDQPPSTRQPSNAKWSVTPFGSSVYGYLDEDDDGD